jgi:transcription elongation factor Elf1
MPENAQLLPRYPVCCPFCTHEFSAEPSILMQVGINTGRAVCPQCNTTLHLQISGDNTEMIGNDYELWLKAITRGYEGPQFPQGPIDYPATEEDYNPF